MKTSRRDFLTMAAAAVASLVIPKAARAETDAYQAQRGGLHITIKAMDNLSGAMQDAAHAFGDLGRELYLNDVRQAFVRGSRLIADNIGATLPPLRAAETDQDVGRSLVQAFDLYANENDIDPCEADSIREDIRDTWGLSDNSTFPQLALWRWSEEIENAESELLTHLGRRINWTEALDWSIPHETVQARIDELRNKGEA